jgi:tetratricopeptide (TPR) repeat protein
MEKYLKACSDPYSAKKFDEALAKCKEAQGIQGRTPYDNFVINQIMAFSYAQTKRFADAYPLFKELVESPYLSPKAKEGLFATLSQIAYQQKDYNAAIDWAQKGIDSGQDTAEARILIADAYRLQGKFKDCVQATQEVIARSERANQRPSENALLALNECQGKINDTAGQGKTIEKLVSYYPKAIYWQNAMIVLINSTKNDDRLLLQVYRLQAEVGTLTRYAEMAQLCMEQGFPGEAIGILQQGLAKGVWTDAREKAKNERLLDAARKKLSQEKEDIAKSESEAVRTANGDLMVAVGASYLFNLGNPEKAASLIQQGIGKGLKNIPLYDAYITLGLAEAKKKSAGEAKKSFEKVDKNDNYERLAKLWSLRTK